MKVALCCIGRLENQYALEYVEYYKNLGFDKIFIYDNNHDGEERFEDVIGNHINDGFVEIIDYRNKEAAQLSAYNDCYQKHGNEYDWIAFFDFDEFLILENHDSIKCFIEQFNEQQCILLNWMTMDDNNLVYNDRRKLMERFTHPMDYDRQISYKFPQNNHVKSIVKGGLTTNGLFKATPHVPSISLKCCDSLGNKCDSSPFKPYIFDNAYLKHFTTKTIEEYCKNKMVMGLGDRTMDAYQKLENIKIFFLYNEKTEEKEKLINDLISKNNLDIYICAYKDFSVKVNNSTYKIVWGNKINYDLTKNGLKDDFYSELYQFKFVNDNVTLKKYIGFCHYRKYFSFMDNIPDMDEIFKDYDIIIGKPIQCKSTIKEQYSKCHSIEDLYIIGGIIADKYPSYSNAWHNFLNGNIFIPYNMFIMKSEDFKEYIKFVFDIMDEYIKIVGTDIRKRIENNKEKYLKSFYPNNTVDYQYRIGGYIAERLTNLFIMTHFKKMKAYPIVITENKYRANEKSG